MSSPSRRQSVPDSQGSPSATALSAILCSLLAAVLLAGCDNPQSWVLWSQQTVGDGSPWEPVEGYESKSACLAGIDTKLAGLPRTQDRDAKGADGTFAEQSQWGAGYSVWSEGAKGPMAAWRLSCFPSTVNPNPVKDR